ncbi:MAG: ATP-dependent 6-phosphofructokinase [Planctomycetota bacterium]|jgi:6-phosphofructokinase 1
MSEYDVKSLGSCKFDSPLPSIFFVNEQHGRVRVDATVSSEGADADRPASFEKAGPREKVFFKGADSRVAIVTCGGLCPGMNDVIRGLVMVAWYRYGVRNILGIRYGYQGLVLDSGNESVNLTPEVVEDIQHDGGTILASSRGPQEPSDMVDFLVEKKIDILFTIGGDGTQRGALAIAGEIEKRKLAISVVGIPKTIDNDLLFTDRTFGFSTAVAASQAVITGAHMESKGVRNGIGLVKLMGRESGFIAVHAALASSDVNLVLIPEAPFSLAKVLEYLQTRIKNKTHAVIVVAEGAGQDIVHVQGEDVSGNKKLGDIGLFLKSAITNHFRDTDRQVEVKYIDPSYIIRSMPANAEDSVFCFQLAQNAVHAAMAGRTAMIVSRWNGHFVNVPGELMTRERKKVDVSGILWQSVLDNTGQFKNMS